MTLDKELKVGRYLFKAGYYNRIDEIEILQVSKTSYYVKYESGSKSWRLKEDFHDEYTIIEKLEVNARW